MASGWKGLLHNHVYSELSLKYLKIVAILPGQGERFIGKEVSRDILIATLNVGTMGSWSNEIFKMFSRRLIDVCCVQESRWRDESALKIAGRNSYYKFFWKGNDSGSVGVQVLVAKKWIDNVISVVRHGTRLIMLQLWKLSNQLCVCICPLTKSLWWRKRSFIWTTACFSQFSSPIRNSCSQGLSRHHGGCGYGGNENTRSFCCYLFSCNKYVLQKEKFAST